MRLIKRISLVTLLILSVVMGLLFYPDTPLPDRWNPTKPLKITDRKTLVTYFKLQWALSDRDRCLAALETGANFQILPDHVETEQCHIKPRVSYHGTDTATLSKLETRCQTALRMAMWERHDLQPAAQRYFDQPLARIDHMSSYNCRPIRTTRGNENRMSKHATADAIDISGFRLADGTRIRLIKDWDDGGAKGNFLWNARDSACFWFGATLGPEYNRLHADHFHLQNQGFETCR